MDMQTDTTPHLAAQEAEIPARAVQSMTEALIRPKSLDEIVEGFAEALLAAQRLSPEALEALNDGLEKLCPDHGSAAALAIWEKVAHDLEQLSRDFDLSMSAERIADCEYETGAAYRGAVKASQTGARVVDQYIAQMAVEGLALWATERSLYRSYTDRPDDLVELAGRIGALQKLSRSFTAFAPWLFTAAARAVFDEVWAIDAAGPRPRLLAAE